MHTIYVPIAGFIVGFLVGLTGMGGGALLTPIMILFFKVSPVIAVGVDFIYSTITKALGVFVHVKQDHVDFQIAKQVSYGSVPAVIVSTLAVNIFKSANLKYANNFLRHGIAYVLMLAAWFLIFKPILLKFAAKRGYNILLHETTKRKKIITTAVGAIMGLIIGLTSIGSGSLIIVSLSFLYPALSPKRLVGTDVFQAFLLVFSGAIIYIFAGSVNWNFVGLLTLGSLPGVFIGSKLTKTIPNTFLAPILAIVLFITGLKLLS